MKKKLAWQQWQPYLKNPAVLLGLVAAAGLSANVALYTSLLSPKLAAMAEAKSRLEQLENQKRMLDKRPVPVKASQQDIEVLVKQVPMNDELARFVRSIKDVEKKSGVTVVSLVFGDNKPNPQDSLSSLLGEAGKQAGAAQPSGAPGTSQPQQAPANAQPAGSVPAPAHQGIAEEKVTLVLNGTYAQTVDFMNQLYQLDRLVNIKMWGMRTQTENKEKDAFAKGIPAANAQAEDTERTEPEKATLTLTFTIYSAKAYAGKFPDLPPLQVLPPEKRQDPILSDDQFINMLKNSN